MISAELQQWLDSHTNFEVGKLSRRYTRPTLQRMKLLCRYMGDPQESVKAIHITGTNGKTSTTRIAESLLKAKGLYTGAVVSPHLSIPNERIRLDGHSCDDGQINRALTFIKNIEESFEEVKKEQISYFEIFVAGAFELFHEEAIDVGIIEVGMGGLYDATNVCNSQVSVITNVELDHMAYLGDTREKIAEEKSGIIKANNNVVIGEEDEDIAGIFIEKASQVNANVFQINEDFKMISNEQSIGGRLLSFRTPYSMYNDIFLPLFGRHQANNALCSVVASEAFIDGALGQEVVEEGFANVRSPGRLEVMQHDPLVIVDGAHNVAGASSLANSLEEEFSKSRRIWIIGLTQEKDPVAMVNALMIDDDDVVIATAVDSLRAIPVDTLSSDIKSTGISEVIQANTPVQAIEHAISIALDDDHIIVTGSLYVVGEIRAHLTKQ